MQFQRVIEMEGSVMNVEDSEGSEGVVNYLKVLIR